MIEHHNCHLVLYTRAAEVAKAAEELGVAEVAVGVAGGAEVAVGVAGGAEVAVGVAGGAEVAVGVAGGAEVAVGVAGGDGAGPWSSTPFGSKLLQSLLYHHARQVI
jgi:hypothetical protein